MHIAYVHYQAPGDTALNHVTQFAGRRARPRPSRGCVRDEPGR
jgi:hypothetical protein